MCTETVAILCKWQAYFTPLLPLIFQLPICIENTGLLCISSTLSYRCQGSQQYNESPAGRCQWVGQ